MACIKPVQLTVTFWGGGRKKGGWVRAPLLAATTSAMSAQAGYMQLHLSVWRGGGEVSILAHRSQLGLRYRLLNLIGSLNLNLRDQAIIKQSELKVQLVNFSNFLYNTFNLESENNMGSTAKEKELS